MQRGLVEVWLASEENFNQEVEIQWTCSSGYSSFIDFSESLLFSHDEALSSLIIRLVKDSAVPHAIHLGVIQYQ